ncbi:MAG: hypothetical protein ACREAA_07760 [Candidatus Polarisedimenticolia bacterium]
MRGASALDDLLAEFPEDRLRVQVIWEPVLATDIAPPMTQVLGLLDDPRVTQYWDPDQIISADIVRAVNADPARYGLKEKLPPGFVAWDVVAVFRSRVQWEGDLPPPAHYAGPVAYELEATRKALVDALAEKP